MVHTNHSVISQVIDGEEGCQAIVDQIELLFQGFYLEIINHKRTKN